MNIYFDETVHDQLGFILLAYTICSADPQDGLAKILEKYSVDEFHALEKMHDNKLAQNLRDEFRDYINWNCRWGVMVFPSSERWSLADEMGRFLGQLVDVVNNDQPVSIYLDEGIVKEAELKSIRDNTGIKEICLCKSHEVNGIQLADLVAALCGVRLREEISQNPKMLQYGNESGFDPPITAELGYELWASLRYSMSRESSPHGDDMPEMAVFSTNGYGLFVSEMCKAELKDSAEKIFGEIYLGCIH